MKFLFFSSLLGLVCFLLLVSSVLFLVGDDCLLLFVGDSLCLLLLLSNVQIFENTLKLFVFEALLLFLANLLDDHLFFFDFLDGFADFLLRFFL